MIYVLRGRPSLDSPQNKIQTRRGQNKMFEHFLNYLWNSDFIATESKFTK